MLTVAVLGPVVVRRDDVEARVPRGLTSALLVRLALDAGRPVRAERLLAELWPDGSDGSPNALQAKVSQLRRALGDAGLVRGDGTGYTLVVEPTAVDALEALRLAEAGAQRLAAGDHAAAATACAAGSALFSPELLPGAGAWALPWRTRLDEARWQLAETGAAARLALGEAAELVGELETLVAEGPLRERAWTLLVTALYRSGRQADALATLRRATRLLSEELGVDPGPELAELGRRVLTQDADLAPVPRRRGNLPAALSPLVGRDAELAALVAALDDHRLVTVVGPGGVGKTRLAVEAARTADAAWLVRLEGVTTSAGITAAVIDAVPGTAAADLPGSLRGADLLLVLDNCEHLAEAVAAVVGELLATAARVRVLATSQRPLGLDGERVHALEPLADDDAIALFTTRATTDRPASPRDVTRLCRALDGLPLAIELAAARTRVLSVAEIVERLDDRFALLRDPASTRPDRRRTLEGTLGWSYDLLSPDDRSGLWALAPFPDGAAPAAVEHVLVGLGLPDGAGLDVVTRLVDRSLVTVGADRNGSTRYRLLHSVRALAAERSATAGAAGTALDALVDWVAGFARDVAAQVRGPGQAGRVAAVAAERATVDTALTRSADHDPTTALRITVDLGWAWVLLDDHDAAARLRRARRSAPEAPADLHRRALLLESWLEAMSGDLRAARDAFDAVDADGDPDAARWFEGFLLLQEGRLAAALDALERCRRAYTARDLAWEEGASALLAAFVLVALGDTTAARAACDAAIRLVGPLGDSWGLLHAEAALGRIAAAEGRHTDAARHHGHAATSARRLGFPGAAAQHLAHLGRAQHAAGDPDAEATLRQAVTEAEDAADPRLLAQIRTWLAEAALARGDRDAARALVEVADAWFAEAGAGEGADDAARLLASLRTPSSTP
ncbi:winged helix-turn-helix domain-containing protein [Actinomycetospora endophytica]|uniref:Winged helix-turn-helix domain-containing protein n=1 Tax=Actinomycetospora endophytica TaxID=2291215 RepID=A0ABS8PEQ6_9PSEU|nr:BTAD domain-containing putative transcriptional regulator [Actinomycetospora endophytica]MCD2196755.1 winged helix-turn-helix domain-containing protein [Actinomycetospora endophytica]